MNSEYDVYVSAIEDVNSNEQGIINHYSKNIVLTSTVTELQYVRMISYEIWAKAGRYIPLNVRLTCLEELPFEDYLMGPEEYTEFEKININEVFSHMEQMNHAVIPVFNSMGERAENLWSAASAFMINGIVCQKGFVHKDIILQTQVVHNGDVVELSLTKSDIPRNATYNNLNYELTIEGSVDGENMEYRITPLFTLKESKIWEKR